MVWTPPTSAISAKVGRVTKPQRSHTMINNTTISIDLAKEVFQVAIFSRNRKVLTNKKVSASKMKQLIAGYPGSTVLMEACGTAHHWGRYFN